MITMINDWRKRRIMRWDSKCVVWFMYYLQQFLWLFYSLVLALKTITVLWFSVSRYWYEQYVLINSNTTLGNVTSTFHGTTSLINDIVGYSIWCWWNFLTSANQIAQIGSCDRSRIHVPDLDGTGVWPGKMAFIKSIKTWIILLYIWLHL